MALNKKHTNYKFWYTSYSEYAFCRRSYHLYPNSIKAAITMRTPQIMTTMTTVDIPSPLASFSRSVWYVQRYNVCAKFLEYTWSSSWRGSGWQRRGQSRRWSGQSRGGNERGIVWWCSVVSPHSVLIRRNGECIDVLLSALYDAFVSHRLSRRGVVVEHGQIVKDVVIAPDVVYVPNLWSMVNRVGIESISTHRVIEQQRFHLPPPSVLLPVGTLGDDVQFDVRPSIR